MEFYKALVCQVVVGRRAHVARSEAAGKICDESACSRAVAARCSSSEGGDEDETEALNFGNFQNITISGYKWNDTDGDGTWDTADPDESGKADWTLDVEGS